MTDELTRLLKHSLEHLLAVRRLYGVLPLLPCLVACALALTGCGQPPAPPPVSPRPVKTVVASAQADAASLTLTGEIRAHDETALGFRLDGRVLTRSVDIGMRVHAGSVLATLDAQTVQNQLVSARSDVSSARATEQVAALNLRRMRALMPSGAIARTQLDSAVSDWQSAHARLESSEAAYNTAQQNLSWASLTAPTEGVVTSVSVSAGQVVSAGQTVMTIAAGDGRDVIIDVADPGRIPQGKDARFQVALLSDPRVTAVGHLRDVSPQADPQTRTWRVRITLNDPPQPMVLGATVTVTLPRGGSPAIALPASALTWVAGQPAVFVLDTARGRVYRRVVVLDRYSASTAFIRDGISPGARVVTAGVRTLRNGERVAAEEENI